MQAQQSPKIRSSLPTLARRTTPTVSSFASREVASPDRIEYGRRRRTEGDRTTASSARGFAVEEVLFRDGRTGCGPRWGASCCSQRPWQQSIRLSYPWRVILASMFLEGRQEKSSDALGSLSIGSLQLLSSGRIDFSQRHYPVDRSRHPRELGWCRPQASLPRSWPTPELRIPNAVAQTRIVSKARIRLDSHKSVRSVKGIICDDISEFESHMPSHAVRSRPAKL